MATMFRTTYSTCSTDSNFEGTIFFAHLFVMVTALHAGRAARSAASRNPALYNLWFEFNCFGKRRSRKKSGFFMYVLTCFLLKCNKKSFVSFCICPYSDLNRPLIFFFCNPSIRDICSTSRGY